MTTGRINQVTFVRKTERIAHRAGHKRWNEPALVKQRDSVFNDPVLLITARLPSRAHDVRRSVGRGWIQNAERAS